MDSEVYSDERYSDLLASRENVSEPNGALRIRATRSSSENELLEKVVGKLAVAECSNHSVVIRECTSDIEPPNPNVQSDIIIAKSASNGRHTYSDLWQPVRVVDDEPKIIKWLKKDWVWQGASGDRVEFQIMRVRAVEPAIFPLLVPLTIQSEPINPGSSEQSLIRLEPRMLPPRDPESQVISILNAHPQIDGSYPYSMPFLLPCPVDAENDLCVGRIHLDKSAWSRFGYSVDPDRVLYHVWRKDAAWKSRQHALSESNWPIRETCIQPLHEIPPQELLTSCSGEFSDWESWNDFNLDDLAAVLPVPSTIRSVHGLSPPSSSPTYTENFQCSDEDDFFEQYYGSPQSSHTPNELPINMEIRGDVAGGVVVGRGSSTGWEPSACPMPGANQQGSVMFDAVVVSRWEDSGELNGSTAKVEGNANTLGEERVVDPTVKPHLCSWDSFHSKENESAKCRAEKHTTWWSQRLDWTPPSSSTCCASGDVGLGVHGDSAAGRSYGQRGADSCLNPTGERSDAGKSINAKQSSSTCFGNRHVGPVGLSMMNGYVDGDGGGGGMPAFSESRRGHPRLTVTAMGCESFESLTTCIVHNWGAFVSEMFGQDIDPNQLQLFVRALIKKIGLKRARVVFGM